MTYGGQAPNHRGLKRAQIYETKDALPSGEATGSAHHLPQWGMDPAPRVGISKLAILLSITRSVGSSRVQYCLRPPVTLGSPACALSISGLVVFPKWQWKLRSEGIW
jgi:hypothetical protein